MRITYSEIRFLLFTNSYSARMIAYNLMTKRNSGQSIEGEIRLLARVLRFSSRKINKFVLNNNFPKQALRNLSADIKIYLLYLYQTGQPLLEFEL